MNSQEDGPAAEGWRDVVKRLPSRQKELTVFCRQFPDSRNLVETNPALALCICCAATWDTLLKENPVGLVERLLRAKRRDACALLGFTGTEAAVRILAKITPEACSLPMLMTLRRTLACKGLEKVLRHTPKINIGILDCANHWRWEELLSVRLLAEWSEISCIGAKPHEEARIMDDTLSMFRAIKRPVQPVQSVGEIRRIHDRLISDVNRLGENDELNGDDVFDFDFTDASPIVFPEPPLPGNAWIEPLTTPELLAAEGREQHHCATILKHGVAAGRLYVYKISAPERATLSIMRSGDRWEIDQLRAACNAPVSEETVGMVKKWLHPSL